MSKKMDISNQKLVLYPVNSQAECTAIGGGTNSYRPWYGGEPGKCVLDGDPAAIKAYYIVDNVFSGQPLQSDGTFVDLNMRKWSFGYTTEIRNSKI